MTRRLSIVALLASALSACQLGGETTRSTPSAACLPVGAACTADAACCSFGCDGVCVANPLPGGMCRTTDDCGYAQTGTYPYVTLTKMTCKAGACTTANVCRDDADVCTYDDQCCAGNCMGNGHCGPNHPPVIDLGPDHDVPYHQLVTLAPVSAGDPDGDPLVYGWTLTKPATSLAALSSQTAAVPTFTPDVVGDYVVTVTVTDGLAPRPNRMTATSTITLHAVNTPPVVNAGADVAKASRNVQVTLHGTMLDPDGDPLTCTWKARAPGAPTDKVLAGPTACTTAFDALFTPQGDITVEGDWAVTLEVSDGVHTVSDSATYNCVNDPPIADAGAEQYWNVGVTSILNPTVPLDGAFSDPNGDAATSWTWSVLSAPATSTLATGTLTNGTTQNASFIADVPGDYAMQLQVCDRLASCGTATTTIHVGHAVRALSHPFAAAAFAKTGNRIALAGPDPSGSGAGVVWLLNPDDGTETSKPTSAPATHVAVSADGRFVVAGNGTNLWIADFSVSVDPTQITNPVGTLSAIAIAGSHAFLFPDSGSTVFHLDYSATAPTTASTTAMGKHGAGDTAGAYLYVLDGYTIDRYSISTSQSQHTTTLSWVTSMGAYGYPTDLAVSQTATATGGHVFLTGTGHVHAIPTLNDAGTLDNLAPIGIDSWMLADRTNSGAIALLSDRIATFNSGLARVTWSDDMLPVWGLSGARQDVTPVAAFVKADGSHRYALVRAPGASGALRTGLVAFP